MPPAPSEIPAMKETSQRTILPYHGATTPGFATAVSLFAFVIFVLAGSIGQGLFPEASGGLPSLVIAEISVVVFLVTIAQRTGALRKNLGLRKPTARAMCAALLVGCSMWYVNLLLTTLLHRHADLPTENVAVEAAVREPAVLLSLVAVGVLPGICEELWFRGWWLRGVANRYSPTVSIIVISLLFSAFHMSWGQTPSTLVLGLVFGWLTLRSGSVVPAILAHICNNVIAVALTRDAFGVNDWITAHPNTTLITALTLIMVGFWCAINCGCAAKRAAVKAAKVDRGLTA
jgi:membrane protease YdiL (CAAX protease family)